MSTSNNHPSTRCQKVSLDVLSAGDINSIIEAANGDPKTRLTSNIVQLLVLTGLRLLSSST